MSEFEIESPPDFEILAPETKPTIPKTRPIETALWEPDRLSRVVEGLISTVYGPGYSSDNAVQRVIQALTSSLTGGVNSRQFQKDTNSDGAVYALRRFIIENPQIVKQKGR